MSSLLTPAQVVAMASRLHPAFNVPSKPALQRYRAQFTQAAKATKLVDACMLAAIVERESGGRNILQENMPPGPGCGVGLCQVTYAVDWSDLAHPTYPGYGKLLDPLTNLRVAASAFLEPALRAFPGNLPAAFAAYNLGISGVQSEIAEGLNVDARTTDGYSAAVYRNYVNFAAASMLVDVRWNGLDT